MHNPMRFREGLYDLCSLLCRMSSCYCIAYTRHPRQSHQSMLTLQLTSRSPGPNPLLPAPPKHPGADSPNAKAVHYNTNSSGSVNSANGDETEGDDAVKGLNG